MSYSNPTAYEQYMGRWSARLAPAFLRFAGVAAARRVLDVGCGTGSLAREILALAPATDVVGVDPTPGFIDYAREELGGPRARFEIAAAESLPFGDGSFDATLALLLLQALDDEPRAAREMARVTRPGGVVATTLWDFRDGMPMIAMIWAAADRVAPALADRRREEHPPPAFDLDSLASLWRGAGLDGVRTARLRLAQEFRSFEDFWLPFLGGSTPICEFAAEVHAAAGERFTEALRALAPSPRPDGSFVLEAQALAVAGTVPSGRRG